MRVIKKSIQGLSMIEVLVTTFILSFGILGTSALQIMALKGTDSAHYRTVATMLSNEMAERIRTNLAGVSSGDYATDPQNPLSCSGSFATFPNCTNLAEACTASQLAEFDKFQVTCGYLFGWGSYVFAKSGGVKNTLPNGSLDISCGATPCGPNIDHTITVAWVERADTANQAIASSTVVLTITP